ncbi:MFS transporter [Acetobacter indonesiensis]|uniref:MFS transporter n=1 Tax=Acetobacter indonesiensis TaxID=104101 RepID=UPI0020A5F813|nr:MFS transporter [Acetobacter indonesiensis]MCP1231119.1 MFS transporter [Acetobacter indonesiensis]
MQASTSSPAHTSTPMRFLPVGTLMAVGMIFGLTYGLSAPLFTLELVARGYGAQFIAANAMMHAIGVLGIAPFLPRIAAHLGPRRPLALALGVITAVLLLLPLVPSIWFWFPLRLALGAATEILLILSESWLNQITDDRTLTRTMGLYSAMLSLGFALGPLILAVAGRQGFVPYVLSASLVLAALFLVCMPWMHAPKLERATHSGLWRYVMLAPIAIGITLLMAMLEAAGSSFLTLYALRNGWSEQAATLLLSVMLLGAITLQFPLGWLGDRMNRRHVMIGLGTASCLGALLWPWGITHQPWAYALLFVWDGLFAAMYTLAMSVVGSRFSGGNLVSIYAATSLAWGFGAFIGPEAAGTAIDLTPHGLPYFVSLACGLFTLLPVFLKKSA